MADASSSSVIVEGIAWGLRAPISARIGTTCMARCGTHECCNSGSQAKPPLQHELELHLPPDACTEEIAHLKTFPQHA